MKALIYTSLALAITIIASVTLVAIQSERLDGEPYADLRILKPNKKDTASGVSKQNPADDLVTAQKDGGDRKQQKPGSVSADKQDPSEGVTIEITEPMPVVSDPEESKSKSQNPKPVPQKAVMQFSGVPAKMVPVPVKALVEYTKYGLIPKVSTDGRKPSDIYARAADIPSQPQPGEPARIAIMINGMGLSTIATQGAIRNLPAPVTLAFGPYGSNLQGWVRMAREAGHEVVLQIPFEPYDYPDNDPGPHTLLTTLPPEENLNRLKWLMARFTGYVGITNSMGEKFLAANASLQPILHEIKNRGLIFVDDMSSARSAADKLAGELGLRYSSAEVILDAEVTAEHIDKTLERLVTIAQERGLAFGVGSNLPLTIEKIAAWSKSLKKKGIVLIPVSAVVRARQRT